MSPSSPCNIMTTPRAAASLQRGRQNGGSSSTHNAKPPLPPSSPVRRPIHSPLAQYHSWSPSAPQPSRRKNVDVEARFWIVAESVGDDWSPKQMKPALQRRYPMSLMIPSHDDDDDDDDDSSQENKEGSRESSLKPRIERDDSGLVGLEFLDDDL